MESVLPKSVARYFETTSHHVVFRQGNRTLDLRTITLEEAKLLAADESFPYLQKKVAAARKKP